MKTKKDDNYKNKKCYKIIENLQFSKNYYCGVCGTKLGKSLICYKCYKEEVKSHDTGRKKKRIDGRTKQENS
jgi:hypothetical protein